MTKYLKCHKNNSNGFKLSIIIERNIFHFSKTKKFPINPIKDSRRRLLVQNIP